MDGYFLKLNDDKSEFLFIVFARRSGKVSMADRRIGNSFISAASPVQNLGVTFDTTMSTEMHVNYICRSATADLVTSLTSDQGSQWSQLKNWSMLKLRHNWTVIFSLYMEYLPLG